MSGKKEDEKEKDEDGFGLGKEAQRGGQSEKERGEPLEGRMRSRRKKIM